MSEDPLLALSNICKSYPGVVAADQVAMKFKAGEIVGLVGKNGAGKSTVIRIIAGVEQPDEGIIAVGGEFVASLTAQEARKHKLAFVHQELIDVPMLTVAENIGLGLGYPKKWGLWIDKRTLNDRALYVLAQINMDIDPARKVSTLSVAQRRMVMIARALVNQAKLIVLDEPTASLTDREIAELYIVIRDLKKQGVCIIYVSHRLQEIMDLTDRVIVMRDGKIAAGEVTKNLNEAKLISLIVGADKKQEISKPENIKIYDEQLLEVINLDPLELGVEFSLSVRKGEILGLAGLAGSGRTEVARQIVGADYHTNIKHLVKSKPVHIRNPADALKHGIALVPEDRRNEGALLNFSIDHNITLSSLKGRRVFSALPFPSYSAEKKWSQRFIDQLGIKTPSGKQIVSGLSGGNQQKVVLARCLAANVDILILDEPTHGVDVGAKEEIYDLIFQLAASGAAIILISSELQELVHLTNRALVLREGYMVGELSGDDLTEQNVLELCFHENKKSA